MEQVGKLKVVFPVESGTSKSGNEWKKQTFVIGWEEPQSGYKKILAFDTLNEKVQDFLKGFRIDTEVLVRYNIESREYNGKYFTNCTAWSVSSTPNGAVPPLDTGPQEIRTAADDGLGF